MEKRGPGPFTVFAPTNKAFELVKINSLLENKEELRELLAKHFISRTRMRGKDFPFGARSLQTASGEKISVSRVTKNGEDICGTLVTEDTFIRIRSSTDTAYIVQFDVRATNGVIHAINTVI